MWFIGDSPVDVSAAVAANPQVPGTLRAIAIPGQRSSVQQLRLAGPCTIVDSLEEAVGRLLESRR
jgi:phosphoglycolate phosphatase-like HAD superfamily hydrolase